MEIVKQHEKSLVNTSSMRLTFQYIDTTSDYTKIIK